MEYTDQLNNLFNYNKKYINHQKCDPYFISYNNLNYIDHKDGYEYLKVLYIKDLWVTETNPSINEGETEELVIQYIETGKINGLSKLEKDIVKNINYTVSKYITYNNNNPIISIDLINNIHIDLMNGLLPDNLVGIYRKIYVNVNNSNMEYVNAKMIEKKLNILIDFINNTVCDTKNEYILKSIIFFSEFLRIHPYKDGNGRTARILFNYIIQNIVICPVSLCSSLSLRSKYIDVLEMRADSLIKYDNIHKLIDYILEKIEKTYIIFNSVCE